MADGTRGERSATEPEAVAPLHRSTAAVGAPDQGRSHPRSRGSGPERARGELDVVLTDAVVSGPNVSPRVEATDPTLGSRTQFDTSFVTPHDSLNALSREDGKGRIGVKYLGRLVAIGIVDEVIEGRIHRRRTNRDTSRSDAPCPTSDCTTLYFPS